MKSFFLLASRALILGLLFLSLPSAAVERKRDAILVWRLEKKQGVTEEEIDSISGLLAAEVEKRSNRKVLSEADVRTILKDREINQQCGGDTACLADLGGALDVPEAVSGDLGRVGTTWVLNLRRLDLRRVEVIARSSKQVPGAIDDLMGAIPSAVKDLFAVSGKTEVVEMASSEPPASEPSVPQAAPSRLRHRLHLELGLARYGYEFKDPRGHDSSHTHSFELGLFSTGSGLGYGYLFESGLLLGVKVLGSYSYSKFTGDNEGRSLSKDSIGFDLQPYLHLLFWDENVVRPLVGGHAGLGFSNSSSRQTGGIRSEFHEINLSVGLDAGVSFRLHPTLSLDLIFCPEYRYEIEKYSQASNEIARVSQDVEEVSISAENRNHRLVLPVRAGLSVWF